jgi:hypothetical protein
VFEPNVEQWRKFKLGQRELSHYQAEILQLLSREGVLAAGDAELLAAHRTIGVQKARRTELIDGIGFTREICRISTNVSDRQWLSIALEGSVAEIYSYLRSHTSVPEINLIFSTLKIAVDIAKANSSVAVLNTFIPVAGGFPSWTPVAGMTVNEEEVQGLLATAETLFTSVGFQ